MDNRISNALQESYIRRYTLTDGKEAGLKVIELNNGILRVLLNESKALDVMQVWHKGVNMSFVSKNGFTARETPFLKRFEGGMVYSCGLDSIGGREGYELHGSLHNTPASVKSLVQEAEKLEVTANVECTSLFGENLLLSRKITLEGGTLLLEDTLMNKGTKPADYCLLYHINVGYPMLDEGVEILADLDSVTPRNGYSKQFLQNRTVFEAPQEGIDERCYFLKNKSNWISAQNQKLGKELTITYSNDTLPALVQWNSPVSQDYALGLEPATSYLDDSFEYRHLQPAQQVEFSVALSFADI